MGKAKLKTVEMSLFEEQPNIPAEPTCFDRSEVVESLAKDLIREHHPELVNLKIVYLWKNKPMQKGGREVIAMIRKASSLIKALTEYDIIMIVSYPLYNSLTDKQQRACIDHELCHVLIDEDLAGNPKIKMVAHDVEEFGSIIERHGLYLADLEAMGRIIKRIVIRDAHGGKKIVKLRPGEDPVERAVKEHEIDDSEFD